MWGWCEYYLTTMYVPYIEAWPIHRYIQFDGLSKLIKHNNKIISELRRRQTHLHVLFWSLESSEHECRADLFPFRESEMVYDVEIDVYGLHRGTNSTHMNQTRPHVVGSLLETQSQERSRTARMMCIIKTNYQETLQTEDNTTYIARMNEVQGDTGQHTYIVRLGNRDAYSISANKHRKCHPAALVSPMRCSQLRYNVRKPIAISHRSLR